jgi:hypothetical protein
MADHAQNFLASAADADNIRFATWSRLPFSTHWRTRMKKLTLNVDDLKVDSFGATERPGAVRGTVQAHERTLAMTCNCDTIQLTCGDTCGPYLSCEIFC